MKIEEWFDVYDYDHLMAWQEVNRTGAWPEGFIPDDVEMTNNWQVLLMSNMADAWLTCKVVRNAMSMVREE